MIRVLLTLSLVSLCSAALAAPFEHAPFTAILESHVHEGRVDYAGLKANRDLLDDYLKQLGEVTRENFDGWAEPERLAFLINLYNAATLQLIIDNYPVTSIKSLGGIARSPWSRDFVSLFGKVVSLDDIEHAIIRKEFAEPRIHFALVCAAKSCPPLRNEAYIGKHLDAQLTNQAESFLRDPTKNRLDSASGTLHLSSIFKWYLQDFAKDPAGLVAYLTPFLQQGDQAWLEDNKARVNYLEYDWSLNE